MEKIPSRMKLDQCKSSCNDLIISSSENLKSLLTSTTMATLLLLRDNNQSERNRIDQRKGTQNDVATGLRPERLPRIFEILVGEIEGIGHEHFSESGKNDGNYEGEKILLKNRQSSSITISDNTTIIWSKKKNRHRMTTLNDEWDGALRWIAGWGLQNNTTNERKKQASSESRKRSRGRSKYKDDVYVSSRSIDYNHDGVSTISAMVDLCVDECIQKLNSPLDNREDSYRSNNNGTRRSKIWQFTSKVGEERFILLQHKLVFHLVFGGLIFFLFDGLNSKYHFTRLIIQKPNQVSYWLAIVGENENHEIEKSKKSKQRQKGQGGKKGRKKKAVIAHNRSLDRRDENRPSNKHIKGQTQAYSTLNCKGHNTGGLISNDVSQHNQSSMKNEKCENSQKIEKGQTTLQLKTNKVRSDGDLDSEPDIQGNKWQVIDNSTSKNSHQQICDEKISCIRGKPILSSKDSNSFLSIPFLSQSFEFSLNDQIVTHKSNDEFSKSRSNLIGPKTKRLSKNDYIPTPIQEPSYNWLSYNSIPSLVLSNQSKNLRIPTDAQREEASRRLREFQMAQVAKLVKKKTSASNLTYREVCRDDSHNVKKIDWNSSFPILSSPTSYSSNLLEFSKDHEVDAPIDISGECLSGDELLLSNMLDEDDEDGSINCSLQSSAAKEDGNVMQHDCNTATRADTLSPLESLSLRLGVSSAFECSVVGNKDVGNSDSDWSQSSSVAATSVSYSWGSSESGKSFTVDAGKLWR